jgi:trans-2,3-dihydro-3-hydroxyanthranilate isomerase
MARHPLFVVDVFAEEKYAGNQLAVIADAAAIPGEAMQKIARETNFSETTFVLSDRERDGGFDVRIFTPGAEIPFAGHPTLGTAYVIARELLSDQRQEIVLNLGVGPIPVHFEPAEAGRPPLLWMRQNPPRFGARCEAAAVAPAVGLGPEQLDGAFPIEEVSTGLPALIVPLRDLAALRQARVEGRLYDALVAGLEAKALLLFCRQGRDPSHQLSVRVFADHFGIPEDPATGSANGCLAGYLSRHRVLGGDAVAVRVGQGHEVGRPSLLHLEAHPEGEGIAVRVGGRVIPTLRGELV